MNTLLTNTTNGQKVLINLDNVTCFSCSKKDETIVCYNDNTTSIIKESFNDIVKMFHERKY